MFAIGGFNPSILLVWDVDVIFECILLLHWSVMKGGTINHCTFVGCDFQSERTAIMYIMDVKIGCCTYQKSYLAILSCTKEMNLKDILSVS